MLGKSTGKITSTALMKSHLNGWRNVQEKPKSEIFSSYVSRKMLHAAIGDCSLRK